MAVLSGDCPPEGIEPIRQAQQHRPRDRRAAPAALTHRLDGAAQLPHREAAGRRFQG